MELVRQKNVATVIVFPLVDADGDPVTSAGSLDSEIDTWADGSTPDGFADCTNEATEIGTTGMYYLSLTQTEMNNDYIIIQIKSTGAKTQVILIRTIVGDPLNIATTDDGGAINVASGIVEADIIKISGDSAAADNLESYTDGTTPQPVNATQISGDSTAADNLEAAADGGSFNLGGGGVVAASVTGNVGGNVTGSVGSLAAQAKADVNAEVLDVINVDTFAEPGQENPAATNTLAKKIGYIFKLLRNKITQTATTLSIFADDASTVDQKATVSDDGTTYTRGEIGTGP